MRRKGKGSNAGNEDKREEKGREKNRCQGKIRNIDRAI